MDLEIIAKQYNVSYSDSKDCIAFVSAKLHLEPNEVISTLKNLINKHLEVKYGLNEMTFDLVKNLIFKDLEFPDIVSLCSINKSYFEKCRKSLYWQKYAKEKYDITEKPKHIQLWFDLIKKVYSSPYQVWKLTLNNDQIKITKKRGNYIYYDNRVQIDLNYNITLQFSYRRKIKYIFRPEYKIKKILFMKGDEDGIFDLFGLDINNIVHYYKINTQQKIDHYYIKRILEDVRDICIKGDLLYFNRWSQIYSILILTSKEVYKYIRSPYDGGPKMKLLFKISVPMKEITWNAYYINLIDHEGNLWRNHKSNLIKMSDFVQKDHPGTNNLKFKTIAPAGIDINKYGLMAINNDNSFIFLEFRPKKKIIYSNLGLKLPENAIMPQFTSGDILIFKLL